MGEHIYKVGDWVRSLVNWGSIEKGEVYQIPHLDNDGEPWFTPDGDGGWNDYLSLSEIEPWTPKVGERVRYSGKSTIYNEKELVGLEGTVTEVDSELVSVKWDRDVVQGISTGGAKYLANVEPLPVAAEAQPAATLKIREGVAYKAANGVKVGPLVEYGGYWNCEDRTGSDGNPGHYTGFGISAFRGILPRPEWRAEFDLIAEWIDESVAVAPSAPVAAQVDAIAEEYGPPSCRTRHHPAHQVHQRLLRTGCSHSCPQEEAQEAD